MSRVFAPLLLAAVLAAGQAAAGGHPTVSDVFDAPNASRRAVADLDLDTEAGARLALQRIASEAGRLCAHDGLPAWGFGRTASCREDAMSAAVRNLKAPLVTRFYAQSSSARAERIAAMTPLDGR